MFGDLTSLMAPASEQVRRRLDGQLQEVNALEGELAIASDDELIQKASELKVKATDQVQLDSLLPEAFALVREASKRTLGLRHFDVQILGGIALHEGQVAEMATGEGKTLVAILPAFLNALSGYGVHVVTTNDYFGASRCCLGLSRLAILGPYSRCHPIRHDFSREAWKPIVVM